MDQVRRSALFIHHVGTTAFFYILSVLTILLLLLFNFRKEALLFTVGLVTFSVVVAVLKNIVKAPRPENATVFIKDPAFPSGHAAGSTYYAVSASIFFFNQTEVDVALFLSLFFILLAAIISVTRVVLRVHTTFQVLVGAVIGIFTALIIVVNQTTLFSLLSLF